MRDLAENWEIDIAARLEEYLEELSDLVVSVDIDGIHASVNFAEGLQRWLGPLNVSTLLLCSPLSKFPYFAFFFLFVVVIVIAALFFLLRKIAALLIQGSTLVYARKIESLYHLVLDTLEKLESG